MIHMLSKFDLKAGVAFDEFEKAYFGFIEAVRNLGLVESSGGIGQRVKNTPMDTAGECEPEYYSIMSFKDRTQLDAAYEHLLSAGSSEIEQKTHHAVHEMIANPVFICWQDRT